MKNKHLLLPLAIAAALVTLPASAALTTTTTSTSIGGTSSVAYDSEGGGYYSNNVPLGSGYISQFNSNMGVLTGATINLGGTQTQTTQVSSTSGGGFNLSTVTSSGSGNSTVTVSAVGAAHTFGTLVQGASCTGTAAFGCSGSPVSSSASTSWNGAVTSGNLNSYVGGGGVLVSSNSNLQAQQLSSVFSGTESTSSQVSLSAQASATYTYLLHAAPSFSGAGSLNTLTLDFGTVNQNASVGPLGFSLFNLSNADRVGLDFDNMSLVAGTDTTALSSNMASFFGLAQGSAASFQAMFNTANVGNFSETYVLNLSDADVGASATRSVYHLTFTMKGTVAAVPEPETWVMLLIGLGLVGAAATRRKASNDV